MIGEPDAGKPHVRFDEGVQETCDIAARLCPTLRQARFCAQFRDAAPFRRRDLCPREDADTAITTVILDERSTSVMTDENMMLG